MIRTVLFTKSAVNTFISINMSMVNNMNSLLRTVHHTRPRKASLAGIRNHKVLFYTTITCLVQNRNHRPCRTLSLQCLTSIIIKVIQIIIVLNRNTHSGKQTHTKKFTVMINTATDRLAVRRSHFRRNFIYFTAI